MMREVKNQIRAWYLRANDEAEYMSVRQLQRAINAHAQEWQAVQGNYNSIEEYFKEVEERGDWYGG